MSECKTCKHEGEICPSVSHYQGFCDGWEPKPITNADSIRAMTDEELAYFMIRTAERGGKPTDSGLVHWLDWLKKEAEE